MAARKLDFRVEITPAMMRLGRLPDDVRNALKAELDVLATKVRDQARANAASYFQVRTGRYLASIKKSVRSTKTSVIARVYSNDPKAHLLEKGVRPHDIRAVNATELAFLSFFGAAKFARMVRHPGMQGHAVFGNAFFGTLGEIKIDLTEAVKQAVKEKHASDAPAASP